MTRKVGFATVTCTGSDQRMNGIFTRRVEPADAVVPVPGLEVHTVDVENVPFFPTGLHG